MTFAEVIFIHNKSTMASQSIFTEHPNEVGMTYWQHMRYALMLSRKTLMASIAALIHAFFPFILKSYTSDTIFKLAKEFEQKNRRKAA
jgi:hypothetical protein